MRGLGLQWQFRVSVYVLRTGIWAGHNSLAPPSVCTPSLLGVLTRVAYKDAVRTPKIWSGPRSRNWPRGPCCCRCGSAAGGAPPAGRGPDPGLAHPRMSSSGNAAGRPPCPHCTAPCHVSTPSPCTHKFGLWAHLPSMIMPQHFKLVRMVTNNKCSARWRAMQSPVTHGNLAVCILFICVVWNKSGGSTAICPYSKHQALLLITSNLCIGPS